MRFEKQRAAKDYEQGHEREQAETNSSEPPARARLGGFAGRGHAVRIGTITMLRAFSQSFSTGLLIPARSAGDE